MFHVFILLTYLGQPAGIWKSNATYETKEQCSPHIEEFMNTLRDANKKTGYVPLVGLCDTEENMNIKREPHDDRRS